MHWLALHDFVMERTFDLTSKLPLAADIHQMIDDVSIRKQHDREKRDESCQAGDPKAVPPHVSPRFSRLFREAPRRRRSNARRTWAHKRNELTLVRNPRSHLPLRWASSGRLF